MPTSVTDILEMETFLKITFLRFFFFPNGGEVEFLAKVLTYLPTSGLLHLSFLLSFVELSGKFSSAFIKFEKNFVIVAYISGVNVMITKASDFSLKTNVTICTNFCIILQCFE
jgi:hypothetical protein